MPWLERHYLFVLSILIVLLALCWARSRLIRSLPRLKWLIFSIVLVYGWTVPGRYIWLTWFSPTDTGLMLGLEQVARLVIVTSSLQIMLSKMTRSEIFTAIYIFLTPLQYINRLQARFALRFALTLEKAEELLEARVKFKTLLSLILQPSAQHETEYTFEYVPLSQLQRFIFAMQCILILLTISIGVGGFWN
ncbi:MAG: hypothetical protein ACRC6G_01425 [Deefgea sp.]